jgi:hypothetical protein
VITDAGRRQLLRALTGQAPVDDYVMMLYVNAYTIVETSLITALVEASWPGYLRQTVRGWTDPIGPISGVWNTVALPVSFRNTSAMDMTARGWAFVGGTSTVFYGGAMFNVPLVVPAFGSRSISPGFFGDNLP